MSLQLRGYFAGLKLKRTCQANPYTGALDCVIGQLALV